MASEDSGAGRNTLIRRKIWGLPIRLFHWALAGSVLTGLYLGEFRSFSNVNLHFYFGYATGVLLLFRMVYGFVGPEHARFSNLFRSLRGMGSYVMKVLRREPSGVAGHNPLGSASVIAMLLALAVQVITGLCSEDDALFSEGPLATYLDSGMVLKMTAWHYWSSRVVLFLVATHLAAILFYALWKRENLVISMITGWKQVVLPGERGGASSSLRSDGEPYDETSET